MHRVLLLPGWLNSDPGHWQSLWEQQFGYTRVEQADWAWPLRGDWMMRLDETLLADDSLLEAPAILVAHSLGCQLVAAWAAHSQHTARVHAALLVAPPTPSVKTCRRNCMAGGPSCAASCPSSPPS